VNASPAKPVPAPIFRNAMATLAAPVSVVTCFDVDGTPRGLTASTVTPLSMDPPLLLVCVSRAASVHSALVDAPWFRVNVLGPGNEAIAQQFAGPSADRFAGLDHDADLAPGLSAASMVLTCRQHDVLDGGDHSILVGLITAVDLRDPGTGGGLLWHQRGFAHARPVAAAITTT